MAIQKSKTLANGCSGNYWKITEERYNRLSSTYTWIISLFKDESTCHSGASHLGISKSFSASLSEEELEQDRTEVGYNKIKVQVSESPGRFSKYDLDLADGEDC